MTDKDRMDFLRYKAQQHPPPWKDTETMESRTTGAKRRKKRAQALGGNPFYEYTVGVNLAVVTGYVTREPRWNGPRGNERVWFRMRVPNQDRHGQNLFVSVRCSGPMGVFVYENVCIGDVVAVSGQTWSARRPRGNVGMFNFIAAERVTGAYPCLIDQDPRYMRVRADLWNRICELLSDEELPLIPEARKQELLARFDKLPGFGDDPGLVEDVEDDPLDPDPDPGTQREQTTP